MSAAISCHSSAHVIHPWEGSTTVVNSVVWRNPWFDLRCQIKRCNWLKNPIAYIFILGTYKKASFSTNHSAVNDPVHQNREFSPNGSVNYSRVVDPSLPHQGPYGFTAIIVGWGVSSVFFFPFFLFLNSCSISRSRSSVSSVSASRPGYVPKNNALALISSLCNERGGLSLGRARQAGIRICQDYNKSCMIPLR